MNPDDPDLVRVPEAISQIHPDSRPASEKRAKIFGLSRA
jgi:hypothetical protein